MSATNQCPMSQRRADRGFGPRHSTCLTGCLVVVWSALACVPLLASANDGAEHKPSSGDVSIELASDERLEQPVEIEIMGRSAISALSLLSKATGVSLQVHPGSTTTTGERKLSIFARGCSLKDIMRGITEALQECYWSVDRSGPEKVHFLRRKPTADQGIAALMQRIQSRRAEEARQNRAGRLELARRGLIMSREEIEELEKSDPLMARSMRHPDTRAGIEMFLSLPPGLLQQFIDTGHTGLNYSEAPPPLQQAAVRLMERRLYEREQRDTLAPPEGAKPWRDNLLQGTISYADEQFYGIFFGLTVPTPVGSERASEVVIHPRSPGMDEHAGDHVRLLLATGERDGVAAWKMLEEVRRKGDREQTERRRSAWVEPADPELHQVVTLGNEKFEDFAEIQRFIANKSGISIVSDYFTTRPPYVPKEARQGMPLWRLLYVLSEVRMWFEQPRYWKQVGKCVVFCDGQWFRLIPGEIPESLIVECREKIRAQGRLTLDDAVALASLQNRPIRGEAFPRDLVRAGARYGLSSAWALLLHASLSPEQLKKARSAEGLPFSDMTDAQRARVFDIMSKREPPFSREQIAQATFHARIQEFTSGAPERISTLAEFWLEFPGQSWRAEAGVNLPYVGPPPDTPSKSGRG